MSLENVADLWQPELARVALDESIRPLPLRIPGWDCTPYEAQSRGVLWLYATPRSILGDITGLGKTIHGIGLTALLKAKGELERAVFVVTSSTVGQWLEEFRRFAPGLRVVTNRDLRRDDRRVLYRRRNWDVLITSYRLMWGDAGLLVSLMPTLVWFDESSTLKGRNTEAAKAARTLGGYSKRIVLADATIIQNGLDDAHAQLEVLGLGGSGAPFGNEWEFATRYMVRQPQVIYIKGGRQKQRMVTTAYQNIDEFTAKLAPFYLRRTEGSDDMPEMLPPEDVWVDMHPEQIEAYRAVALDELGGSGRLVALQQITAGLRTWNPAARDVSAKLDRFMLDLDTKYAGHKVIVFSRFIQTGADLGARLTAQGIGHGFIDGPHAKERDRVRHRFWDDPDCRVVIGTTAMERGMNLQIAKYVCTIDLMFNPARIEQIVGRIKRSGSPHKHVSLVRYLASETIDEGVLNLLRVKQTLADAVNGEVSDLFVALTPDEQRKLLMTGTM